MELNFNVVNLINTALCAVIVIVGIVAFTKTKSPTAIMIASAFFLFFVSHTITFLSLDKSMEIVQIIVRIFAYLFALDSVLHMLLPKKVS